MKFCHIPRMPFSFRLLYVAPLYLCLVSFLIISSVTPALANRTIAKSARIGGDATRMTFVVILSKKVPIKVFTLAKPYRVVIDLPEVNFQFPKGLGRKGKGMISAYRYGLFSRGKSRIVIDVKYPVLVTKKVVLAAKAGKPARMEIELVKTSKANFALNPAKRALKKPDEAKKVTSEKLKIANKEIKSSATKKTTNKDQRPMIVIDPGHGGVDPGAIGAKGTLEKEVVLKFSKVLKERLLATGLYRVAMTRSIDTYIPLHDRVKIGRDKGASLFISVHADSISKRRRKRNSIRGASIYILSERASDKEAKALAALENRSDIIAGIELPESEDPVSSILIDLAQRETNELSYMFAKLHLKQMRGAIRLHGYRTRSAGFRVLKAPDIPSVLLELGYLSSIHDEKNLKSSKWRQKMANALLKSIETFFSQQVAINPY